MEQDLLLLQDQVGGMDIIAADKWAPLKKGGPSGAILKSSGSRHSMSRTCGPREMISLVIPRVGDNKVYYSKALLKCLLVDLIYLLLVVF
jgi:hypothetical protein